MTDLKYNWEIDGHNKILAALEADILSGKINHAYLFAGPDNIGKMTVAKKMAHILQCPEGYCHNCSVCNEIDKGYHSDTIEVIDNGESIKIEEVRNFIEKANLTKQTKYKILLIQNIERMTPEAANSLLKTLEDPPQNVIFILTTSRIKDVLPTIISRVRLYTFHRLRDEDVENILRKFYPLADTDELKDVSGFAMGRPGLALDFMREPELLNNYRKMYNDIWEFVRKPNIVDAFIYIDEIVKQKKDEEDGSIVKNYLDTLTAVLRKHLIDLASSNASEEQIKKYLDALKMAQRAQELLKRNVNNRLLLENLMLNV